MRFVVHVFDSDPVKNILLYNLPCAEDAINKLEGLSRCKAPVNSKSWEINEEHNFISSTLAHHFLEVDWESTDHGCAKWNNDFEKISLQPKPKGSFIEVVFEAVSNKKTKQ
jgi:hypothetical protein